MHRGTVQVIAGVVGILISASLWAAPFFGANPANAPAGATPALSASGSASTLPHVMSPDEFSSQVNTLSQAVNSQIAQQASAALAQRPLTTGGGAAPTTGNVMTTPPPFTANPPGATQNNAPQRAANNPNTITAPSESEEGSEPVFTGFAPTNTNAPPPRSSGNASGGGWNVQY